MMGHFVKPGACGEGRITSRWESGARFHRRLMKDPGAPSAALSLARPRAVKVVEAEDESEAGAAWPEAVFDACLDGQRRADGVNGRGDGAAVVVEDRRGIESLECAAELPANRGSNSE